MNLAPSTRQAVTRLADAVRSSSAFRVPRVTATAVAKRTPNTQDMPFNRAAVEEVMSAYVEANRGAAEPFAKAYHRLLNDGDEFLTLAYEEAQDGTPSPLSVAKRAELRATIEAEIEKRALRLLSDDAGDRVRKRHPRLTLQQACAEVLANDPDLYEQYDSLGGA